MARFAFGPAVLEAGAKAQEAMQDAADAVRQGKIPDIAKHGGWCAVPFQLRVRRSWRPSLEAMIESDVQCWGNQHLMSVLPLPCPACREGAVKPKHDEKWLR